MPKILFASIFITLAGCGTATKVVSSKDADYTKKISSIAVITPVAAADSVGRELFIFGQLDKIATQLDKSIGTHGIKTAKIGITRDELNPDEKINQIIREIGADHVARLFPAGSFGYSEGNVATYDYVMVVVGLNPQKEVWKTRISAQWQSDPVEMARSIVNKLVEDGLISK